MRSSTAGLMALIRQSLGMTSSIETLVVITCKHGRYCSLSSEVQITEIIQGIEDRGGFPGGSDSKESDFNAV